MHRVRHEECFIQAVQQQLSLLVGQIHESVFPINNLTSAELVGGKDELVSEFTTSCIGQEFVHF